MIDALSLSKQLISIPSLSGEEREVAEHLKSVFISAGFDEVEIDECGSVIAKVKGKRDGVTILMDGHIDTVPVKDRLDWKHDPYGSEIDDGKLYGRGASDMKAGVACMAAAASYFAENRDFAGTIAISCTVEEECFEGVSSRYVSSSVKPDYVIIGEATTGSVKIGQRGRAEIIVEAFGRSCHSSNPEKGDNAALKLVKAIEALAEVPIHKDDLLGEGILVLTDIISSPYPGASVVPDYAKATFDRRLLVGETPVSVVAALQKVLDEKRIEAKVSIAYGEALCYTGKQIESERFFPAWKTPCDSKLVTTALTALESAGLSHEISHYAFCTNGSHFAGEAGIETIGYGPSLETLAHTPDEYIEVSEIENAVKGYIAILKGMLL